LCVHVSAKAQAQLRHLTKQRVETPPRQPPTKRLYKQWSDESFDDLELHDLKVISETSQGRDTKHLTIGRAFDKDTQRPLSDIDVSQAEKYLFQGDDDDDVDSDSDFTTFKHNLSLDILEARRQVDALLDPTGGPGMPQPSSRRFSDHYRKLNTTRFHPTGIAKKLESDRTKQPATPMPFTSDLTFFRSKENKVPSPRMKLKLTKPAQLPSQTTGTKTTKESRFKKASVDVFRRQNRAHVEHSHTVTTTTTSESHAETVEDFSGAISRPTLGLHGGRLSYPFHSGFSKTHTLELDPFSTHGHGHTSLSLMENSDSDDEIMV